MKGVHVVEVALPGDGLAVARELEPGYSGDRTIGRMIAGQPLRIKQGELAGLHRQHEMRALDAARCVARIDLDAGCECLAGSVGVGGQSGYCEEREGGGQQLAAGDRHRGYPFFNIVGAGPDDIGAAAKGEA